MRRQLAVIVMASTLVSAADAVRAADGYPRTIVCAARASNGETTITSTVRIAVDRLVEPARRDRLIKGLSLNGYQGFMDALRPLPIIGKISTQSREVAVRYAWESIVEGKKRLIVVSDKPLFFLTDDSVKARAGYELTVVELVFDDKGGAKGTMAGAARVKPAPEQGIVLQDYAASPVELTVTTR